MLEVSRGTIDEIVKKPSWNIQQIRNRSRNVYLSWNKRFRILNSEESLKLLASKFNCCGV